MKSSFLIIVLGLLCWGHALCGEGPRRLAILMAVEDRPLGHNKVDVHRPDGTVEQEDYTLVRYLTHQIAKRFPGIRASIKRQATQYDLWSLLNNPEYDGLIWVSHAGGASQFTRHSVIDSQGQDVGDLFKYHHSGLRYMAVIGCESLEGIEGLEELQKKLLLYASDRKISAKKGIRKAMLHWSEGKVPKQKMAIRQGMNDWIKVVRSEPGIPLKVEIGGEVVGFVMDQEATFSFDSTQLKHFNLTVNSGDNSMQSIREGRHDIGHIQVDSSLNGSFHSLVNLDGTQAGGSLRSFRYKRFE